MGRVLVHSWEIEMWKFKGFEFSVVADMEIDIALNTRVKIEIKQLIFFWGTFYHTINK